MQPYLWRSLLLFIVLVWYYYSPRAGSSRGMNNVYGGGMAAVNGTSILDNNKEKFTLESAAATSLDGTSTTEKIINGSTITTTNPSDLLPSDSNASFAGVSGGNTGQLADQIIPAELMDPSRQPNYTSTSKSRIPNLQLRADPPVDRSVTEGQFWNQTPDVQPDMYKSVGVEIKQVLPPPISG